jgi:methyl-accepting chemotaxis protein
LLVGLAFAKGVAFAEMVAGGDLTQRFEMSRRDEVGKLAAALGPLRTHVPAAGAAVSELSKSLANVNEMSQGISAATEEQTSSAKQVSLAVESVKVTQAAAASADEMSGATEEMSRMARGLQKLVKHFRIAAYVEQAPQETVGDEPGCRSPTGSCIVFVIYTKRLTRFARAIYRAVVAVCLRRPELT